MKKVSFLFGVVFLVFALTGVAEEQPWCEEDQQNFYTDYEEDEDTLMRGGGCGGTDCITFANGVKTQCVIYYMNNLASLCQSYAETNCPHWALCSLPPDACFNGSSCEVHPWGDDPWPGPAWWCGSQYQANLNYCMNMYASACVQTFGQDIVASLCNSAWQAAYTYCGNGCL